MIGYAIQLNSITENETKLDTNGTLCGQLPLLRRKIVRAIWIDRLIDTQ